VTAEKFALCWELRSK